MGYWWRWWWPVLRIKVAININIQWLQTAQWGRGSCLDNCDRETDRRREESPSIATGHHHRLDRSTDWLEQYLWAPCHAQINNSIVHICRFLEGPEAEPVVVVCVGTRLLLNLSLGQQLLINIQMLQSFTFAEGMNYRAMQSIMTGP